MSEHFCYITVASAHVGLGFYYGAEVPDPQRLLEGEGKLMRRAPIRSHEDLDQPALRRLVEVATTHHVPPARPDGDEKRPHAGR